MNVGNNLSPGLFGSATQKSWSWLGSEATAREQVANKRPNKRKREAISEKQKTCFSIYYGCR